MGKLKRFKPVALRCEKTKRNFFPVALAAGFMLIKSIHRVYGKRAVTPSVRVQTQRLRRRYEVMSRKLLRPSPEIPR